MGSFPDSLRFRYHSGFTTIPGLSGFDTPSFGLYFTSPTHCNTSCAVLVATAWALRFSSSWNMRSSSVRSVMVLITSWESSPTRLAAERMLARFSCFSGWT